jgi:MbtH protein
MTERAGTTEHDDEGATFTVVLNDEEQYAIWPQTHELPAGWREAGRRGSRAECLAYVEQAWTDLRPLSVRRRAVPAGARPCANARGEEKP